MIFRSQWTRERFRQKVSDKTAWKNDSALCELTFLKRFSFDAKIIGIA